MRQCGKGKPVKHREFHEITTLRAVYQILFHRSPYAHPQGALPARPVLAKCTKTLGILGILKVVARGTAFRRAVATPT